MWVYHYYYESKHSTAVHHHEAENYNPFIASYRFSWWLCDFWLSAINHIITKLCTPITMVTNTIDTITTTLQRWLPLLSPAKVIEDPSSLWQRQGHSAGGWAAERSPDVLKSKKSNTDPVLGWLWQHEHVYLCTCFVRMRVSVAYVSMYIL